MPNSSVEKCCNTSLLLNYWLVRSPGTSQVSPQFRGRGIWGCRFRDLTRTEVYACPSISIQTDSSTQCQRFFFLWRVFLIKKFYQIFPFSKEFARNPKKSKKIKSPCFLQIDQASSQDIKRILINFCFHRLSIAKLG